MTIQAIRDIKDITRPYITEVQDYLQQQDMTDALIPDHICIKCKSSEQYDQVRKVIESAEATQFSYQATITGRRIAYCKLVDGIPYGEASIKFIELSDHKKSEDFAGVHHIELYPASGTLKELIPVLGAKSILGELKERPHHTSFDITLPTGFIIRLSDGPLIKKIAREILED